MTKKLLIGVSTLLLLGGVLFGIGSAVGARTKGPAEIPLTNTGTGSLQENKQEMDPFSNVEISVVGADIYLVEGDNYTVAYQFHDREVIESLEVRNDTLYLSTDCNWDWKPDHGKFYVVVTVPKDTPLNVVNLSTVAGDVIVENRAYAAGELSTTSGEVALSHVTADQVNAETVSGAISVQESKVQNLSAENKTGHIQLDGEFATVNAYSVSSACELNGSLSESASIETISGEIVVSISNSASIEANTYGKVSWNSLQQGYSFAKAGGDAQLTLKSVSGKIRVNEGAAQA